MLENENLNEAEKPQLNIGAVSGWAGFQETIFKQLKYKKK